MRASILVLLLPALAAADTRRITFANAIESALQHNPSAQIAAAEIARADALVWQTRAPSLPTLTGNLLYTLLDNNRVLNGNVIAGQNQIQLNAQVAMLLSPARWAQWSHSRDNLDVARRSATETRRQIALAAGRTYLTIVAQHRQVELSERALVNARAHFDFAKQRYGGGVGTKIDVVRAEQEVASTEAQLAEARVALVRAQEALGVLLDANEPIDVTDEPTLALPSGQPDTSQRSDVVAARARTTAARHATRDHWTDFLPTAALAFTPFFQDPPTLTVPKLGWQFTLSVQWALWDGGLRYGQQRERRALLLEAQANEGALGHQAASEVRAAEQALRGAEEAAIAAKRAAALTHEALDLANLAYRAGATTNLEVIDAERRARDADTAAVLAEDSARQARLELASSLGAFP